MPATVSTLLNVPAFRLSIIGRVHERALDREIAWVHSSDLADPTPWLEPGQLLLTNGLQFSSDTSLQAYEDYVRRLVDCGIVALGFATLIVHDAVPALLIDVCDRAGLLLLEVAGRAPFMAIIRHVADVISTDQRGRLEWLLGAQRAVARAALRPDGLQVILRELERQLDCWVELYDGAGARVESEAARRVPPEMEPEVSAGAREALRRGIPAGMRVETPLGGATLQTLGGHGRLLGVLGVGTPAPLDPVENDLVSSVISLASIALEQSRVLQTARLRVRTGMLELLLAGVVDVAEDTAKRLWGPLPLPPLRVAVTAPTTPSPTLLNYLELRAERNAGSLFFAERDGDVVVVVSAANSDALVRLLEEHGVAAGVSGAVEWATLAKGIAEGRSAARQTHPNRLVVGFESLAEEGMLGVLGRAGAETVAHRMLAPLLTSPNPDHQRLLHTAAVWMEHHGAWDPAARELNIHRHTLRNRLKAVERMLALDLSRFSDRVELWTALQHVEYQGRIPPAASRSAEIRG